MKEIQGYIRVPLKYMSQLKFIIKRVEIKQISYLFWQTILGLWMHRLMPNILQRPIL